MYKEGCDNVELTKQVQAVVGTTVDGAWGPATTKAVKEWQSANGLVADGIVGPATLGKMGIDKDSFLDTDNSASSYTTDNGLLIQKHFLPKGEYLDGPTKKEYAFLHHTAGWNNPFKCIDSWGRDSRGRIATEFVLGGQKITNGDDTYDGVMVQCMPDGAYGWHLGSTGSGYMHKHSVGIEICNFGYLTDGKTYVGTKAHDSQIVTLSEAFKGKQQWHKYSDAQIEATRKWCLYIAERDNIDIREGLVKLINQVGPTKAFEFNGDAYYGKVKGLLSHTNVRKDKTDVFPQQELVDMLLSL